MLIDPLAKEIRVLDVSLSDFSLPGNNVYRCRNLLSYSPEMLLNKEISSPILSLITFTRWI